MLGKFTATKKIKSSTVIPNFNFFKTLPDAVVHHIFGFLRFKDHVSLERVDKGFNALATDATYWKNKTAKLFTHNISNKRLFHTLTIALAAIAEKIIVLLKDAKLAAPLADDAEPLFTFADNNYEITAENVVYSYYGKFKAIIGDFDPSEILEAIINRMAEYYNPTLPAAIDLKLTGCVRQTFLHFFAVLAHQATLQRLVAAELELNQADAFGITPAQLLFEFNAPTLAMLDFLIESAVDFNTTFSGQPAAASKLSSTEPIFSKNIICHICLVHAANTQYLRALTYLIERNAFQATEIPELVRNIRRRLDDQAMTLFDSYLEVYHPTQNLVPS